MGMAGAAFASTSEGTIKSYDWYLYYNDSQNKVELCDWKFERKYDCVYTAIPYTSTQSACTLIQPGYATSFVQPSYVCLNNVVYIYQERATGQYAHVQTKLSTNFHPASTTGRLHD